MRGNVKVPGRGNIDAVSAWLFVLIPDEDAFSCARKMIALVFVRNVYEAFGSENLEVTDGCVPTVELTIRSEGMMFSMSGRYAIKDIACTTTSFFPIIL